MAQEKRPAIRSTSAASSTAISTTRVELQAALGQHPVERLGLGDGAREAVKDEAVGGVRLTDALGDDAVDDVVGDELAPLHHRLRLLADVGALGHRLAQHLAGRELRDAVARP